MHTKRKVKIMRQLLNILTLFLCLISVNAVYGQEFNELADNPYTEYDQIELADKYFMVPIYNVSIKGVSIPIALNYDATGYRYKEQTLGIGLNWNISAGPKVNKIINSIDDTDENGWYYLTSLEPYDAFYDSYVGETNGSATESTDLCRDEFEFSINGEKGVFVLKRNSLMPKMITGHNFKVRIEDIKNPFSRYLTYIRDGKAFKITDEDGIIYEFVEGDIEWDRGSFGDYYNCQTNGADGVAITNCSYVPGGMPDLLVNPTIKNYVISKIINPYGETIKFEYEVDINIWTEYNSDVFITGSNNIYKEQKRPKFLYNNIISKIITSKEIVYFDYKQESPEEDDEYWILQVQPFNLTDAKPKLLSQIRITDAETSDLISTYKFEHGKFDGNEKSRLDTIYQVSNLGNSSVYRIFSYERGVLPLYDKEYLCTDLLGFYNNRTGNTTTIPINNPMSRYGNRFFDGQEMETATLKYITYPNKGIIGFNYRVNAEGSKYAGGLLVNKITQYDENGNILSDLSFNYSGLEGYIIDESSLETYYYKNDNDWKIYSSEVLSSINGFSSYKNANTNEFSFPYTKSYFDNSYRPHKGSFYKVIEIIKNTGDYGKIKCIYETDMDNTSMSGTIKNIIYYDQNSNIVKYITYNRSYKKYGTPLKGINIIDKKYIYEVPEGRIVSKKTGEIREFYQTTYNLDSKVIEDYRDGLTSRSEIKYTYNSDGVIKTTEFTNSSGETYLAETTTNKDLVCDPGELFSTYLLRPIEKTYWLKEASGNKLLKAELNFYNEEGELTSDYVYLTEKPIISSLFNRVTNYCNFTYDPKYTLNKRINYDQGGNVESVYEERNLDKSYIYGYGLNRYIIAELSNNRGDENAYSSFEFYDNVLVSRNISSSNVTFANSPENAITGDYYGVIRGTQTVGDSDLVMKSSKLIISDISPKIILPRPLPGGKVVISNLRNDNRIGYIVSFWAKTTSTLTGSLKINEEIVEINSDWNYYETTVNGLSTFNIQNITSVSVCIDEIRVYASNATMNTYTYKPFVGITSECDVNNNIPIIHTMVLGD